jgi:hypothetical protein
MASNCFTVAKNYAISHRQFQYKSYSKTTPMFIMQVRPAVEPYKNQNNDAGIRRA